MLTTDVQELILWIDAWVTIPIVFYAVILTLTNLICDIMFSQRVYINDIYYM